MDSVDIEDGNLELLFSKSQNKLIKTPITETFVHSFHAGPNFKYFSPFLVELFVFSSEHICS